MHPISHGLIQTYLYQTLNTEFRFFSTAWNCIHYLEFEVSGLSPFLSAITGWLKKRRYHENTIFKDEYQLWCAPPKGFSTLIWSLGQLVYRALWIYMDSTRTLFLFCHRISVHFGQVRSAVYFGLSAVGQKWFKEWHKRPEFFGLSLQIGFHRNECYIFCILAAATWPLLQGKR